MAISYVGGKGAGNAGSVNGSAIDITTGLTGGSGGAPIEGDLVIVSVCTGTAGRTPATDITTPSGYTPLTAQDTTATTYDTNFQVSYKIMGATPDTSVTIPASGNNADGQAYVIQVFRGVDPTTPMDATPTYATGSGANNRPDPAVITPVTTGAWIVVTGGGAAATGGTYTATYLTNFLTFNGVDTNDASVGAGYYTAWTSGSYDPAAFTGGSATTSDSWGATTLALRPALILISATFSGYGILAASSGLKTGIQSILSGSSDVTTNTNQTYSATTQQKASANWIADASVIVGGEIIVAWASLTAPGTRVTKKRRIFLIM